MMEAVCPDKGTLDMRMAGKTNETLWVKSPERRFW